MRFSRIALAVVTLTALACSSSERAREEAQDANDKVVEERKELGKAEDKLAEEEGELREAQADADAKAVKLDNRLQKDTAAKRP